MVHRVLVPIDGSSQAETVLPHAEALLEPDGELVLLRVVPEPEPEPVVDLRSEEDVATRRQVDEWWRERAAKDFALARPRIAGDPSRVREVVATGDPAEEIVRLTDADEVDLIAMTTHGRGTLGQLLFGSVAHRVARVSPVPVLLVRPAADPTRPAAITRLVLPYDGSAVAAEAFPVAARLSKQLGVPVHLVQAVYTPATPMPEVVLANVAGAAAAGAARDLEQGAAQLRELGVDPSWEVLDGSPFFAITEATRPGDVLILTSHGRTGVRRWLLGSVAEKLVQQATVPVILVPARDRRALTAGDAEV